MEKYKACFILHALGDTIGFRNGIWEFNYGSNYDDIKISNRMLYDFIALGGINHMSIKDWMVSDDTILHLAVAKALIENYNDMNELGNLFSKYFIEASHDNMEERLIGITLKKNIKALEKGNKWDDNTYDFHEGGSGASMRSSCIGLAFHGKTNRKKLIKVAIESSRITHNSATGYLGGLVSALFTAYAIEGISINQWPYKLINLLESGIIEQYLKKTRGYDTYERDKETFINKWKLYISHKFKNGKPVKHKLSSDIIHRNVYYNRYYGFKPVNITGTNNNIGGGGDDSVIIAYDTLLDSGKNWEKLIVYSMLHFGDTDTTGCIAGSWYGALYGFEDAPMHMIKDIEYIDVIEEIAVSFYKKYYKL